LYARFAGTENDPDDEGMFDQMRGELKEQFDSLDLPD
jgi:hypothetical protein